MRKPSTRTGVATVTTQGGSGPITSENYVQRAIEYARSHGGLSVIRRHSDQVQGYPATHARWKAWMEWKLAHSIRIRGALAAGIAVGAVRDCARRSHRRRQHRLRRTRRHAGTLGASGHDDIGENRDGGIKVIG